MSAGRARALAPRRPHAASSDDEHRGRRSRALRAGRDARRAGRGRLRLRRARGPSAPPRSPAGAGVRVAAVANFPAGDADAARRRGRGARRASRPAPTRSTSCCPGGALPRRRPRGDRARARRRAARGRAAPARRSRSILETGRLGEPRRRSTPRPTDALGRRRRLRQDLDRQARARAPRPRPPARCSRRSATPAAAASRPPAACARRRRRGAYLRARRRAAGPGLGRAPATFRIGASSLLGDLLAAAPEALAAVSAPLRRSSSAASATAAPLERGRDRRGSSPGIADGSLSRRPGRRAARWRRSCAACTRPSASR